MAHEIEEHDGVVLHGERAWHGLGTIVEDAPTPLEALKIAKLDWGVRQWELVAQEPVKGPCSTLCNSIPCDQVANVRTDIGKILGIVSPHYEPIQNKALAEFCEALAEQTDTVKVESAGSIRNGAKVWFLLKGESFSVRDRDEVRPYILVSNGHDGGTALRCTPTTIRVVCSNTLHMVIPETEGKALKIDGYTARHIGNVKSKVEEAKAALSLYGRSLDLNRSMIDRLAARDVSSDSIKQFFLECYVRDFGPIAETPITKVEVRKRHRAFNACRQAVAHFNQDRDLAGASAWNALNSYTRWLQHDKNSGLTDSTRAEDSRLGSALFGVNANRGVMAMQLALSM